MHFSGFTASSACVHKIKEHAHQKQIPWLKLCEIAEDVIEFLSVSKKVTLADLMKTMA